MEVPAKFACVNTLYSIHACHGFELQALKGFKFTYRKHSQRRHNDLNAVETGMNKRSVIEQTVEWQQGCGSGVGCHAVLSEYTTQHAAVVIYWS
jgi:hypothetical protein